MEHGFTEAEVDEQLAIRRTAFRNAVAGVTTRRSETLADALVSAAEGDFVFTRPETSQALFEAAAPSLDAAAVTAAFRARMERSDVRRVGKECVSTCRSRWSPYA